MNLDEAQRQQVAKWISEGAKLSEIQKRLLELGVKLTYMEVRFLVDDLKLTPKDPEPPKVVAPPAADPAKLAAEKIPARTVRADGRPRGRARKRRGPPAMPTATQRRSR